jgi:hypothetical protein
MDYAASNSVDGFLLPGGSPAFNFILNSKISQKKMLYTVYFSHSVREYEETIQPDGTVSKTNIFKHKRWITI